MLERIILAAIATFCIYLFLNTGTKPSKPVIWGGEFSKIPNFIYSIPLFSR